MRHGRLVAVGTTIGIGLIAASALSLIYRPLLLARIRSSLLTVDAAKTWETIKDFGNSAFAVAVIGSLVGAFAGAYGGYMIVEKGKRREELLKEIRSTNAAIMVAFGICNALLSTKQNLIRPLKEKYDAQRAAFSEHVRSKTSGRTGPEVGFEFQADFETVTLPPLAVDILQSQVFEKLSLVGRPLLLVTTLRQALYTLEHAMVTRNDLIQSYKQESPLPTNLLIQHYFGLPYGGGHVNQDYPAALEAMYEHTDSAIFFSHLLCGDLGEHGDHLAEEFQRRFGSGAPTIAKPNFKKAEDAELIPSADKFADWLGMFVKKPDARTVD